MKRTLAALLLAVVPLLLGAPARAMGIHEAARKGKTKELQRMLVQNRGLANAKDRSGKTPLHHAAKSNPKLGQRHVMNILACIKLLLMAGGDVNAKDKEGRPPLNEAVANRNAHVVNFLLQNKADPDVREGQNQQGALHTTVFLNDPAMTKLLLEHKADPDIKGSLGRRPLHEATKHARLEIVKLLVKHKADVNAPGQHGDTPLHWATTKEVVKLLIGAGARLDVRNVMDYAPLHQAAAWGHPDAVKAMLEAGADVNAAAKGSTPLVLAERKLAQGGARLLPKEIQRYQAVVAILKKHGGKRTPTPAAPPQTAPRPGGAPTSF